MYEWQKIANRKFIKDYADLEINYQLSKMCIFWSLEKKLWEIKSKRAYVKCYKSKRLKSTSYQDTIAQKQKTKINLITAYEEANSSLSILQISWLRSDFSKDGLHPGSLSRRERDSWNNLETIHLY